MQTQQENVKAHAIRMKAIQAPKFVKGIQDYYPHMIPIIRGKGKVVHIVLEATDREYNNVTFLKHGFLMGWKRK